MGQCQSAVQVQEPFSDSELRVMKRFFKSLAERHGDELTITKEDFLTVFRLPGVLGERAFDIFDSNRDNLISWDEFEKGLVKNCRGSIEERQEFIFNLFDTSGNKVIHEIEFRLLISHLPPSVVTVMVKECEEQGDQQAGVWIRKNISSQEISSNDMANAVSIISKRAFSNSSSKGVLSYDEFITFLESMPILYDYFSTIMPYDNNDEGRSYDNYNKTVPRGADTTRAPLPFHSSGTRLNEIDSSLDTLNSNKKRHKNRWENYTKAYWCIECNYCKKRVRFCTNCRGELVPVEETTPLTPDGNTGKEKRQIRLLRCQDCGREINLRYCSACGTQYAGDGVKNKLDRPQDNENVECKGGDLYSLSRFNKLNRRYIYIRENFMYYYTDLYSSEPNDVYFLGDCSVEKINNPGMESRGYYGFSLQFPRVTLNEEFFTTSEKDREEWIYMINKVTKVRRLEDEYEVKEKIGEGKFAEVFKCISKENGQVCAVKIINRTKLTESENSLIQTEIGILSLVNHKNIVQLYDNFETATEIYIVMELIKGGELFDRISGRPILTEIEAYRIFEPLVDCVSYLHRMGIIHRDLKPENIFCGEELWDVKIGDFGLSKLVMPKEEVFYPCGTINYVAPEVLTRKGYTAKADMWSLGVILYLILRGKLPFQGKDQTDVIQATIKEDPDYNNLAIKKLSKECQDVIKGLLDKNQNTRYSADELLHHPWFKKMKKELNKQLGISDDQSSVGNSTTEQVLTDEDSTSNTLDLVKFAKLGKNENNMNTPTPISSPHPNNNNNNNNISNNISNNNNTNNNSSLNALSSITATTGNTTSSNSTSTSYNSNIITHNNNNNNHPLRPISNID